ncbi:hypothetical protein X777_14440 [Ooceraea biroi]|uniref:Uncharacterized protein n=1 Tax=Ooceraea biroi TaxID=2015173 RepID=A0A026VW58_OOCBI|nr:hypothetical protein X777_14440 [Ooceraea biroi]
MLTVQRTESLRGGEGYNPPSTHLLPPIASAASVTGWKPAERSVSFNRDVHVKRIVHRDGPRARGPSTVCRIIVKSDKCRAYVTRRVRKDDLPARLNSRARSVRVAGRGTPRVTAALVGDGEGRLTATPVHKESIAARSKEDLAQEAALVLQQAGTHHSVAHDNRRSLPGRFSTLPARRNRKRPELPIDVRPRRGSEEIGATTVSGADLGTPRARKKPLERSASDASTKKLKGSLTRFFSPKSERRHKPVGRSASDAGAWTRNGAQRKRSGSESEGSHLSTASQRAKKQLSPIIEASPHVDQQPFHFGAADRENNNRPEPKKPKKQEDERMSPIVGDADEVISRSIDAKKTIEETTEIIGEHADKATGREAKVIEHHIFVEGRDDEEKRETGDRKSAGTSRTPSPPKDSKRGRDEVDETSANSMLHNSRYNLQQRNEESTIHKMIHRLSNDRSPPPQLTRTMVSPSPGFGHNNNRPFSYTRPNESCSPPPPAQTNVIYAQVQPDKKKAQRSHSDSDEGLGLERKDSSRENSPAEKEYRRTDYSYSSELRRNNEINTFKSKYEEERMNGSLPFGKHSSGMKDFIPRTSETARRREFDDIDRRLYDKPEKYTSTVFVDTSGRGRADGMDSRRRDSGELRQNESGISHKTSELSARRDLLESRIKSRLMADEMFAAAKNSANVPVKKSSEHEIIDKPIVPSPVTPNRIASPKRYMDTYITETRTNSNGEKYIFEKEMHEDNGKVYGYEKKITNKIPANGYLETKPKNGYTVETRTDKYGDKYIVETRTHEGYADNFKPFLSDRSRSSPEERFQTIRNGGSPYKSSHYLSEETTRTTNHIRGDSRDDELSSPIIAKKLNERKFSKSDDFLDRETRPIGRETHLPKTKKPFESIRGMSKSTQRLDEVGESNRVRALRSEYTTRSHENLSSRADYVNARNARRPGTLINSPTMINGRRERSPFAKRHLDSLREGPNDDYDTDISQMTNSQLESKYYKETRTTHQRYTSDGKHPIHDDYDSSPPRIRTDRVGGGGYNSSRYDSDTTARDSIRCETRYDETSRTLRKEHRKLDDDPKKPLRRSRNRLDYFDDSDSPRGKVSSASSRLETFNEGPTRPPRTYHEGKSRHARQETRTHTERRHRETRLSDPDRKDRLADSGIENDYRRDSQEADRREQLESEDEGFVSRQFIKHERRHTDRNMNLTPEQRKYDKYVGDSKPALVTTKPPSGAADKKYEKKAAKKSGTMSKVKQLFSKKEKKAKEEKGKKNMRSGSSGALTDDEVTMRYREYRGYQLRSAKSARDLGSDINQVREVFFLFVLFRARCARLESVQGTMGSSISRVKRDRRYPITELSLSDVAGIPYEE